MSAFNEVAAQLGGMPLMGRERPELAAELRSFPVPPFVIFYIPTPTGVRISRVLHGARDVEGIFGD